MYRKDNGKLAFSATRMAFNVLPVFMQDSSVDPGHISMPQKDLVFTYQSGNLGWDDQTIHASLIIDHKTVSKDIFKKLQKINVIDQGGVIYTENIGSGFTHSLAKIPAYRQKQLIDMLFWWEEECQRLRKLEAERQELRGAVESRAGEEYVNLLERVEKKIRAKPSARDELEERDEDQIMLRFRAREPQQPGENVRDEVLPEYSR